MIRTASSIVNLYSELLPRAIVAVESADLEVVGFLAEAPVAEAALGQTVSQDTGRFIC